MGMKVLISDYVWLSVKPERAALTEVGAAPPDWTKSRTFTIRFALDP